MYSITAHECPECVQQLYDNIIRYNAGLRVLVVFHINEALHAVVDSIPSHDNLLFNPTRTDKARFTASIFLAHLDNYRFVKGIDFGLFCTLASNSLFVRQVDMEHIEANTPALAVGPTGYSLGDTETWSADEFVKNEALVALFKERDIKVEVAIHFGAYFRKETMGFIAAFCEQYGITTEIFPNDKIAAEEIVLSSLEKYATGRVAKRYAVWLPTMTMEDVKELIETGGCRDSADKHYTIIRVGREETNEIRKMITQTEHAS